MKVTRSCSSSHIRLLSGHRRAISDCLHNGHLPLSGYSRPARRAQDHSRGAAGPASTGIAPLYLQSPVRAHVRSDHPSILQSIPEVPARSNSSASLQLPWDFDAICSRYNLNAPGQAPPIRYFRGQCRWDGTPWDVPHHATSTQSALAKRMCPLTRSHGRLLRMSDDSQYLRR